MVRFSGARRRWSALGVSLVAGGSLVLAGGPVGASSTKGHPTTTTSKPSSTTVSVHTANESGLGTVLVTSSGRTLYLFTPDKQHTVTCSGACAAVWPPLVIKSGKPKAENAVKGSMLGTVRTKSGTEVVTYNHWPLYTYAADSGPGQHHGQGISTFGGTWYAVSANGQRAQLATQQRTTTTGGGGGYSY